VVEPAAEKCPKGKVRKKGKCVKKHTHKKNHKRHAKRGGEAHDR